MGIDISRCPAKLSGQSVNLALKYRRVFGGMITGWKVVVNKQVVFTDVNVLPCFDFCVANGLSTKIVKPINSK